MAAELMLLIGNGRGTKHLRIDKAVVLPHLYVGEMRARRGFTSQAPKVCANGTHRVMASGAPWGKTT